MVWLRVTFRAAGKHASMCIYFESQFKADLFYTGELQPEYLGSAKNTTTHPAIRWVLVRECAQRCRIIVVSCFPNLRFVSAVAYNYTFFSIAIISFPVFRFHLFRDHGLLLCDTFTLTITISIIRGKLKLSVRQNKHPISFEYHMS